MNQPDPESWLAHVQFIRSLARSLLRDASAQDDLVQDALLVVMQSPPRAHFSMRAWLSGIVRNVMRQSRRSNERRERHESSVAPTPAPPSPDQIAEQMEAVRTLTLAVESLDEPYRTVIVLRHFHELTPVEIAQRMDVPLATVHTRLRRGLELLRGRMDMRYRGERTQWGAVLVGLTEVGERRVAESSALTTLVAGAPVAIVAVALVIVSGLLFTRLGPVRITLPRDPGPVITRTEPAAAMVASPDPLREPVGGVTPEQRGSLRVHVRSAASGAPIAHAQIEVRHGAVRPDSWLRFTAATDATGVATFADLAAGAWVVALDRGSFLVAQVEEGSQTSLAVDLPAGITVRGVVVDEHDAPVANASVLVWNSNLNYESPCVFPSVATTDGEGRFELAHVPPRGCWFGATLAGHAPSELREARDDRDAVAHVRIQMPSVGGAVEGFVLDESAAPIPDAIVQVHDLTPITSGEWHKSGSQLADGTSLLDPPPMTARSDETGAFRVASVRAGVGLGARSVIVRCFGYVSWWGHVDVVAGGTSELDVTLQRGATLTGVVRDGNGNPVRDVPIRIGPPMGEELMVFSRADGSYRLEGAPLGQVVARANLPRNSNAIAGFASAELSLVSGAEHRWDPVLLSQRAITGHLVTDAGVALSSWWVSAIAPPMGKLLGTDAIWRGDMRTDTQGGFTLVDPPNGEIGLECHAHGRDRWPYATGLRIEESTQSLTVVVPSVAVPSAAIRGHLLERDGSVARGAFLLVRVLPYDQFQRGVEADASGAVDSGLIPPGRYAVSIKWRDAPDQLVGEITLGTSETRDLGTLQRPNFGSARAALAFGDGVDRSKLSLSVMRRVTNTVVPDVAVDGDRATCGPLMPGPSWLRCAGFGGIAWLDVPFEVRADQVSDLDVRIERGAMRALVFRSDDLATSSWCRIAITRADGQSVCEMVTMSMGESEIAFNLCLGLGEYHVAAECEKGERWAGVVIVGDLADDCSPITIPTVD